MSESDRLVTPSDFLLFQRCPRSLHVLLAGGRLPAQFPADELYPMPSERSRVRGLARSAYPRGVRADALSPDLSGELPRVLFGARCSHGRLVAEADIWRLRKTGGRDAVLVREGTSIKESYLREAAVLDYCFRRCNAEPERIIIVHVNKGYERQGDLDLQELFVERDVTRRIAAIRSRTEKELDAFLDELDADPELATYRDELCSRRHSCPLCSHDIDPPDTTMIESLHRGGHLIRELRSDGFTHIVDVPAERLAHPRQRIQRQSLLEDRAQVDTDAIRGFLARLEYPRLYLDFEATSTAIPPFDGTHPWEHLPYLYSLHRDDGTTLTHTEYLVPPGEDARRLMVESLLGDLGDAGSIVVYSAGFERGIISRLAEAAEDRSGEILALLDRIVDLLEPFQNFLFYHHDQGGKVSLKTVLPVLTDQDYSHEEIQDGYTANHAYRYLASVPPAGDEGDAARNKLLADLASYCEMDTMAMVHIVSRLEDLIRADS